MMFRINGNRGFTLVEIFVTMAVVSVIMVAVISSFNVQQESQVKQQLISEVQQNARSAMYLLAWDVRMAGYALGEGKIQIPDNDASVYKYIKAIEIYDNERSYTDVPDGRRTDWVEILYADSTIKSNLIADMPDPSAIWKVDDTVGFEDCDIVIISDAEHSTLMEITQVIDGHALQHNKASCSGLNPDWTGAEFMANKGWGIGAEVHRLRYMTYAIQNENTANPWLGVDNNGKLGAAGSEYVFQRYVEDIEDLQAVYIFEDEDEASFYDDTDGDDTNDFDDIRAARITIVARTRAENKGFGYNKRPQIENGVAGSSDRYGRRILSLELKIRNIDL